MRREAEPRHLWRPARAHAKPLVADILPMLLTAAIRCTLLPTPTQTAPMSTTEYPLIPGELAANATLTISEAMMTGVSMLIMDGTVGVMR